MAANVAPAEKPGAVEVGPDSVEEKSKTSLVHLNASEHSGSDEEVYDTSNNPFKDPAVAEHWRTVYDDAKYECRFVFDPEIEWSEEEEKKLIRKLDMRVCLWAVSIPLSFEGA